MLSPVAICAKFEPNAYRVSLALERRALNVAKVAEKFGGGGHRNAAGCRVTGDWDECENELVSTLIEAIEKYFEENGIEEKPELSLA